MSLLGILGIIIASVVVTLLFLFVLVKLKRSYRQRRYCGNHGVGRGCGCGMSHVSCDAHKKLVAGNEIAPDLQTKIDAALAETFTATPEFDGSAPSDGYAFAKNDFGSPGATYEDYMTSQAVSIESVKNHAAFVEGVKSNLPQHKLGRPTMPDTHESYSPVDWVGLRPPRAVQMHGDPKQIADMDQDWFRKQPITIG